MRCSNHKCVWLPLWRGWTWDIHCSNMLLLSSWPNFGSSALFSEIFHDFSTVFLLRYGQQDGNPSTSFCYATVRCSHWPSQLGCSACLHPAISSRGLHNLPLHIPHNRAVWLTLDAFALAFAHTCWSIDPVQASLILTLCALPSIPNSYTEMVTTSGFLEPGFAMLTNVDQTFLLAKSPATNTNVRWSIDQVGIMPNWSHSAIGAPKPTQPIGFQSGPQIRISMARHHSPRWNMLTCSCASRPSLLSLTKNTPGLMSHLHGRTCPESWIHGPDHCPQLPWDRPPSPQTSWATPILTPCRANDPVSHARAKHPPTPCPAPDQTCQTAPSFGFCTPPRSSRPTNTTPIPFSEPDASPTNHPPADHATTPDPSSATFSIIPTIHGRERTMAEHRRRFRRLSHTTSESPHYGTPPSHRMGARTSLAPPFPGHTTWTLLSTPLKTVSPLGQNGRFHPGWSVRHSKLTKMSLHRVRTNMDQYTSNEMTVWGLLTRQTRRFPDHRDYTQQTITLPLPTNTADPEMAILTTFFYLKMSQVWNQAFQNPGAPQEITNRILNEWVPVVGDLFRLANPQPIGRSNPALKRTSRFHKRNHSRGHELLHTKIPACKKKCAPAPLTSLLLLKLVSLKNTWSDCYDLLFAIRFEDASALSFNRHSFL